MIYKVPAADLKALQLNEQNPIASVLQNVAVILATPKGSAFYGRFLCDVA